MKKQDIVLKLTQSKTKPFFFGLGFIQCKISDKERFHFYHPDLKATVNNKEEVHNHRYDFNSLIISGNLTNKISKFITLKELNNGFIYVTNPIFNEENKNIYYKEKVSCIPSLKIKNPDIEFGTLELLSEQTYHTGESYFMDSTQFHTVNTNNSICITQLIRTNYTKDFANVIRPLNQDKVCPFEKVLSEEECWNYIYLCLEKIE